MYDRLDDEQAAERLSLRPHQVAQHRGDRHDFLRRHERMAAQAVQRGRAGREEVAPYLFGLVADPRALRLAWDHLHEHGGSAPGPDGLQYEDLSDTEVWDLCRGLRDEIRAGAYRPGPEYVHRINKGAGRGERPLVIQSIADRVVQRAIVEIAQPLLDPLMDAHSFGFRPGRNRLHALALAEHYMIAHDRAVWVTEDLRDAFLRVPIERLLEIVQHYLASEPVTNLVGTVLSGASTPGLRQGGPLSPLLLNIHLHHFLDAPWRRLHPDIPLLRVADDLLIVCRSKKEAARARQDLDSLLRPTGMQLKGSPAEAIRRLTSRSPAEWLGFRIVRSGSKLQVDVAARAWERLEEHLLLATRKPNAPLRAIDAIRGWISQMGPCFAGMDHGTAYVRIREIAARHGFDEIPARRELIEHWQRAHARWRKLRRRVARRGQAPLAGWAGPVRARTDGAVINIT